MSDQSAVLELVYRARCSHCGDHQLVTEPSKRKAKWILINMLNWLWTESGWICFNCRRGNGARP